MSTLFFLKYSRLHCPPRSCCLLHLFFGAKVYQKRSSDQLEQSSAFSESQKRAFDYGSVFHRLHNTFDHVSRNSHHPQHALRKKAFDSIDHSSVFGGLRKKASDTGYGTPAFGRLLKRALDSIDHSTSFGELDKKSFDSIDDSGGLGGLGGLQEKRSFDATDRLGEFGGLEYCGLKERSFDAIDLPGELGVWETVA